MTTPEDSPTNESETSGQRAGTDRMDADQAARRYLHSRLDTHVLPAVLGEEVFETWAQQVQADDRYRLYDPANPDATTSSAGGNPPPAMITQYGPGPRDYIVTHFDAGQVLVTDANDDTGRTWKYPESAWRRFVAAVRGEELPESLRDPAEDGPTQFEEAAEQNARTGALIQADRDANERARERADRAQA